MTHMLFLQVILYSTQGRDHTYDLIQKSIKRAIQYCQTHDTFTLNDSISEQLHNEPQQISQKALSMTLFRQKVIEQYETPRAAFDRFKNVDGMLTRKAFKALVGSLDVDISDEQRKQLRKQVSASKVISLKKFLAFMKQPDEKKTVKAKTEQSGLAALCGKVPVLPKAFKSRPYAQEQLILALLDAEGNQTTSVSSTKSRVSSQGMVKHFFS